jgi:hypothetical protein
VNNVGYVMITYGVFDAIFSIALGSIINLIGRIAVLVVGSCLNFVVIGVFFNWIPNPDQKFLFFILAAIWGVADAVWQTQINCKIIISKSETLTILNGFKFNINQLSRCASCVARCIPPCNLCAYFRNPQGQTISFNNDPH